MSGLMGRNKENTRKFSVSIIVPVYNAEQHISECVESLINQTLDDIQIIFVDDRSTDSSMQIVHKYAANDPRIITFSFDQNSGPAQARNFGLSRALGEYVQFVDADDMVPKDSVKTMYEAAKDDNADLVRGNGVYFDVTAPDIDHPMQNIRQVQNESALNYCDHNFHGDPWYHPLFLFRKNFLIGNDIRYPNLRLGEDPVFLLNALIKAKGACTVSAIVYRYRTGIERTEHFEDQTKANDYFSHLIMLKDIWVKMGMQHAWDKYFDSTFWWPWENYLAKNDFCVKRNHNNLKLIFDSLSEEYTSSLEESRAIFYGLIKHGNHDDVLLYANRFSLFSHIPGNTSNSRKEELDSEAIYDELVGIYTSKSWKATRIFRKLHKRLENRSHINLIKSSEYFDAEWYAKRYPDVAKSKISPAKHYFLYGWKEGRDPSNKFSTNVYLSTRKYLLTKGLNPLIHYINHSI
jgi:glycosyltransferase involved in cell wall biosynthesis